MKREAGKSEEEEAPAIWRALAPEHQRLWSEIFIPNLVKLVHEGV